MVKLSRRKFITKSIAIVPTIGLLTSCKSNLIASPLKGPIVVSTWDSGLEVNKVAWEILGKGGKAIDAVEKGANSIENQINCCVGLGGNPDRDGYVTLDACIMDENHNCGSVAFLEQIKHPISVARKVMEKTPHVMLVGEGALQFAMENGFVQEPKTLSKPAEKEYKNWLKKSEYKPIINIELGQGKEHFKNQDVPKKLENGNFNHDTMGLVALDSTFNLSGACTTSGMGFKMRGRVGDSPIIGAGLFVDNEIGAATSSGQGEEVIRICGTHLVVELMRNGNSPYEACKKAIERLVNINKKKARDFQVGFLALNKAGEYGAYAVQPGFSFSVTSSDNGGKTYNAESYFK
ncbi:MAG: N(4)-(beta-N-acetylglucosaminyl)-L-asparaginase [Saprospiraceae bacterium]|nr:N(4)-(beta-N-acetylglucosaminyl)-L-asparaginase [Saprospiraceae bacterium]